jgi:8-oxo-dGTP diphosphatase
MTKVVRVAAAVILRPDGAFLLGQRAPGTFYPGYWEFPGGKVEPGESPHQALVRELAEELGIRVTCAEPWIVREFVYPHAHVQLNFFRVRSWAGEIRDIEHSALAWQLPGASSVAPMLPANAPVLRALALPDLYAITHAGGQGIESQLAGLDRLAPDTLVQVREPAMDAAQRAEFAATAVARGHARGLRVLINDDIELAHRCAADGVHLKARTLMHIGARPDLALVGASCHDLRELGRAAELELDFAVLGPLRATATHPDAAPLGWEHFARLIQRCPLPVYAIGGLGRGDLAAARAQGAHGIAAIRAAWEI